MLNYTRSAILLFQGNKLFFEKNIKAMPEQVKLEIFNLCFGRPEPAVGNCRGV